MSAIPTTSGPIVGPSQAFHIQHYEDVSLADNQTQAKTNGILSYLKPFWSPTTTQIGVLSVGAGVAANKFITNLAPKIMYELVTLGAVASPLPVSVSGFMAMLGMGAFGIPAMPAWAITAGSFVASELALLGLNGCYSAYKNGKGSLAEKTVNNLMNEWTHHKLYTEEVSHIKQEIKSLQRLISDKYMELNLPENIENEEAIARIKAEQEAANVQLQMRQDALSVLSKNGPGVKIEGIESSIVGSLTGLYGAKKDLDHKLGSVIQQICKDVDVDAISDLPEKDVLSQVLHSHIQRAARADNEVVKEQELKMAHEVSKMLLAHWKYLAANEVYRAK